VPKKVQRGEEVVAVLIIKTRTVACERTSRSKASRWRAGGERQLDSEPLVILSVVVEFRPELAAEDAV
jgi:hypothetical protein